MCFGHVICVELPKISRAQNDTINGVMQITDRSEEGKI
jgi:hypothetical protein